MLPSIMLGRERFALPIGETRIGGAGAGALPFSPLRRLQAAAALVVGPDGAVTVWPRGRESGAVTINGVPLGAQPIPVTHGAKIDVAGVRLILRDGRETGTTGPSPTVTRELLGRHPATDAGTGTREGARLVRQGSNTAVDIPESGLVIGRDPDSDLVVSGMEVSRRHAVLRGSARGYVLTDVSTNGTYVNGRRVGGMAVLRIGDAIRIGEEDFRFAAGRATYDPSSTPSAPPLRPSAEPPTAAPARRRLWSRLWHRWRA